MCRACKTQRAQCRSRQSIDDNTSADNLPTPKKFADALTADHEVINDDESFKEDRMALIIQDRFTHWIQGYSSKTKSAEDTKNAFQ